MAAENNGGDRPIVGLSVALDERDHPTQEHCDRVTELSLELGRQCGLTARELDQLAFVARLHDVGKIGIPDSVLKKPGALDAEEWVIMRTHSVKSERIVLASGLEDGAAIAAAVRHHHERFDGSGYPDGIAGAAIPILARIVAITDTYDAMANLRMYGPTLKHRQIMDEMGRVAGTQHDPDLAERFSRLIEGSRFRAPIE